MTERAILITGCSSGIGLASARMLKSRGWRVLATARKSEDLERLARDEGVEALPLELADPESVAACAQEALHRTGGHLDALFNNAGFGQTGAVEDITADLLRYQIEVNLIGAHELTRRVLPAMRANGAGRIVYCSSVLGLVAGPFRGAYCASKFAMEGLTDALRLELRDTGIKICLIEPGPIRTRFLEHVIARARETIDIEGSPHREAYRERLAKLEAGGDTAFKLEPEAVATKLVHAVESPRPKARYFVTKPVYVADFLKRVLPTSLLDRALLRM